MNIPNTMKMKAATRLTEKFADATPRGRRPASVAGADRPGRIAATASLTAWRFLVAKASSPSAPSSVGFGCVGIAGVDGRDDREAGPKRDLLQHVLGEGDAHRDPLHDLGEVAGRVVRRQQRELRARGGRNRRHHALTDPPVERVDGDVDLLARLDVAELGLLEIGVDVRGVERARAPSSSFPAARSCRHGRRHCRSCRRTARPRG